MLGPTPMSHPSDAFSMTSILPRALVIDTNVVLDMFVYGDASAVAVDAAVRSPQWRWVGSAAMRDELEHVLAYAHIAARLVSRGLTAIQVLAHYDSKIQRVEAATRCNAICKDPDDQIFIDLAVQHGALLVS